MLLDDDAGFADLLLLLLLLPLLLLLLLPEVDALFLSLDLLC